MIVSILIQGGLTLFLLEMIDQSAKHKEYFWTAVYAIIFGYNVAELIQYNFTGANS